MHHEALEAFASDIDAARALNILNNEDSKFEVLSEGLLTLMRVLSFDRRT